MNAFIFHFYCLLMSIGIVAGLTSSGSAENGVEESRGLGLVPLHAIIYSSSDLLILGTCRQIFDRLSALPREKHIYTFFVNLLMTAACCQLNVCNRHG